MKSGAAIAVTLLLSALALHIAGSELAQTIAVLGVVALIVTPAASLAATALESWQTERMAAWLALTVLAVLAIATGLAISLGA